MKSQLALLAAMLCLPAAAVADTNIIPFSDPAGVSNTGTAGVLHDSNWSDGTASALLAPLSATPQAEQTQWNVNSFWWDQAVSSATVYWQVTLKQTYALNRFVVQADNNDTYSLEYLSGSDWKPAWDIGALAGYGLMTRDSGKLAPITTNALRFSATGGDNYYALSQLQAFAVPAPLAGVGLPAALALLGFGRWRRGRRTS